MTSNNNNSVDVTVRVEQGGGGADGCLAAFLILVIAAPWFAPTIALGTYIGAFLEWHSLAVTILSIVTFGLNYYLLLLFARKLPRLFILLGAIECAALCYVVIVVELQLDIYWTYFWTLIAGLIGFFYFTWLLTR